MDHGSFLGDSRLSSRLDRLRNQLGLQSGESVPSRIVNRDQVKAYYRFINNKRVTPVKLSEGNRLESLKQAWENEDIILAVQDTTELDFTSKRSAARLGPMEYKYRRGMYLHNHILLSRSGIPLGIFSQRFRIRGEESLGHSASRRHLPLEQKESYRWLEEYQKLENAFASHPAQQVLCICDREGDFHELLQCRRQAHVHYLIRSRADRRLDQSSSHLYEEMAKLAPAFAFDLFVPERNKQPARMATLSVRYTSMTIRSGYRPREQKQLEPVEVYVVEVRETSPPPEVEPICWRLLTSMPVLTHEMAREIVQFYACRWVIERFHFVLKQGFQVENRQIEHETALQNAIVMDSWPALQICAIQYQALNHPQAPIANIGIHPKALQLLVALLTQKYQIKQLPDNLHTIGGFHRLVAILGGFQNQKNRDPGVISLWRGWKKLMFLLQAHAIEEDVGNH